jgi:hypothetical protein
MARCCVLCFLVSKVLLESGGERHLLARLRCNRGHRVHVRILDVRRIGTLEINGDREGVQREEVDGIRFGGYQRQPLPETLLLYEMRRLPRCSVGVGSVKQGPSSARNCGFSGL